LCMLSVPPPPSTLSPYTTLFRSCGCPAESAARSATRSRHWTAAGECSFPPILAQRIDACPHPTPLGLLIGQQHIPGAHPLHHLGQPGAPQPQAHRHPLDQPSAGQAQHFGTVTPTVEQGIIGNDQGLI